MEPRFFEHPMEMNIVAKNQRGREIGDKGVAFESGEEKDFWSKLSGGLKKGG